MEYFVLRNTQIGTWQAKHKYSHQQSENIYQVSNAISVKAENRLHKQHKSSASQMMLLNKFYTYVTETRVQNAS
jgi:hypothetical protein